MNASVYYWDRGIDAVPEMTGAASLLDASDMVAICEQLGLELPLRNVLDVGCGTGRLAKLCDGYLGVDIARSAVEYCRREGLAAYTITGPEVLPSGPFGLITCLSVFTHIGRDARQQYLQAFAERTTCLLVDVLHGTEGGNIAAWYADPAGFMEDMEAAGYGALSWVQGSGVSIEHTYYLARKAA